MGSVEWRDGNFQKTSQNARHVTPASIPESSMLCSPLSTFPKALHPTPVKDKQSPEALLSHLIKEKENQSERKLKNWMAERWDGGRTAGLGLSVDGGQGPIILRFLNTSIHSGKREDGARGLTRWAHTPIPTQYGSPEYG